MVQNLKSSRSGCHDQDKKTVVVSISPHALISMENVSGVGMPSVLAIHRELARRGYIVKYFQVGQGTTLVAPCHGVETIGIEVPGLPQSGLLWRSVGKALNLITYALLGFFRTYRILKRHLDGVDRAIIYGHTAYGAVLASLLARAVRRPNITRLYGTLAPYHLGMSPHYPKSHLEKLIGLCYAWEDLAAIVAPASRYIITNDGTLGERLFRAVRPTAQTLVFPRNGIDIDWHAWLSTERTATVWKTTFAMDAPTIVTAGRLMKWKRFDRVVDVASQLRNRGVHVNVAILGSGPEDSDLVRRIDDARLADRVKIIRHTPHSEMPRFLYAADVILLLQDYTNLSNTLLEALSLERPVVALDVGGTGTVIRHKWNGYLVSLDNCVPAAAEALAHILSSEEEQRSLSRGAREWRELHGYSWEKRAEVDINEIRHILKSEKPHR
ncbi:MAG: glycosyltransferase [Bryobacterales bacterium]|nr:glycosyltransferase [Bryobacterales bacterium]